MAMPPSGVSAQTSQQPPAGRPTRSIGRLTNSGAHPGRARVAPESRAQRPDRRRRRDILLDDRVADMRRQARQCIDHRPSFLGQVTLTKL